jgi:uncharacterized protein YnzC (UPF0291/DUF896 family)
MLSNEKIERINVLSKKSRSIGLTSDEKLEQKKLREEYIQSVRNSLKSSLMTLKVVDEEGHDITPEKLKIEKENRKKH